jgi:cytidylate kinase
MYRALTWLALQQHANLKDGRELERLARGAEIVISRPQVSDGRQYTVTVHGRDVTWDIRDASVTQAVSQVSTHPEVRAVLRDWQRELARRGKVVMVGRDIGAVVLPDAEYKIYLTASLQERARRRYAELIDRVGKHDAALPTFEEIMQDIQRRDNDDYENMRPARDAIVVETDALSVPQVLEIIYRYVEQKV